MKPLLNYVRLAVQSVVAGCAVAGIAIFAQPIGAQQIKGDSTLPTVTAVSTIDNRSFTIEGGTQLGNNLFHSFEQFSIPTQGTAVFSNSADIANIISRVTGGQISSIDGLIQANGLNTNLFFLNSNGIVFGPDAQLQIGGSFVASSAESLRFTNGVEFKTGGDRIDPLLSISTPIGLQLGASSGSIRVNDTGHTLLSDIPLKLDSSPSLRVNPGRTLALIGSDLEFEGGIVAAPGGQVVLGGVREGLVELDIEDWRFDYDQVEQFGDMRFSARSLVDASSLLFGADGNPYAFGAQGGAVQLHGRQLFFEEGSRAIIQNYGSQPSGNLHVEATDSLRLLDRVDTGEPGAALATMSFAAGAGGQLNAIAPRIVLSGDASISTETFSNAASGKLTAIAKDSVLFEGSQDLMPDFGQIDTISYATGAAGNLSLATGRLTILGDGVSSQALGSGPGGVIDVSADQIIITDGGSISSATLASGNGGSVRVQSDSVEVKGINPITLLPSIISAAATSSGDAGNVTIKVRQLLVSEGGRVDSSTLATGDAGAITISADELVSVSGMVPGSVNPSLIISSANIVDPALRAFFASIGSPLPDGPTGNSGDVTINAPRLVVSDGAQVTVRNDGTGNAGTLSVNAGSVYLSDRAGITASTQQGSGGNLVLNLQETLLLRRGSGLSAEAGGLGNGGNIALNVPVIIALENSDIIANAFRGAGGNIQINAQAVLGTEFRETLTPESDITASSEFGVSGKVEINRLESDPSVGTVKLPENVADSSRQIVAGCSNLSDNQFTATGRGGLPPNPTEFLTSERVWVDTREIDLEDDDISDLSGGENVVNADVSLSHVSPTEAIAWIADEQGQVRLVASDGGQSATASTVACLKR